MQFRTGNGDNGFTSTCTIKNIPKNDILIITLGYIDDLMAQINKTIVICKKEQIKKYLREQYNNLTIICTSLAFIIEKQDFLTKIRTSQKQYYCALINENFLLKIEERFIEIEQQIPKQNDWLIFDRNILEAEINICRTKCRLIEPLLITLKNKHIIDHRIIPYFNILSDLIICLAILSRK